MAVTGRKVLRFTADLDIYDSQLKGLQIVGARLVAGSGADATAKIWGEAKTTGEVLYSFAAVQKTSDDSAIPTKAESGKVQIELSGAGAEVYLYLG